MTETETTAVKVRSWIRSIPFALVGGILFVFVFGFGLVNISQDGHSLSVIDEHIHFDTAVRAEQGVIPWRGMLLGPELVDEWACGVGHEGGGLPYPCGDDRLGPESIPSGKYSTGYAHYPTYFFGAAAFHGFWQAVTGSDDPLDAYRAYSAFTLILGVVACAVFAWLLGLRGARFLAATAVPVASSMIVFTGTIVNPSSTAILAGALIGGTGLLWMQRGRGFTWFALAVAFSAAIAVTDSLAAGGFALAMVAVLVGRRFGWDPAPDWRPRWWQVGVLAAIILAPVIVWGRIIAARATIPDEALYDFIPPSGVRDILIGATKELALLHTPWRETGGIRTAPTGFIANVVHAFSEGAPVWITVLVFGSMVLVLAFTVRRLFGRRPATQLPSGLGEQTSTTIRLLAIGTLATIVLYPPALRISNWLTFGFDFPIVERYSNALAPLLVLLLVMLIPNRAFVIPLTVIGVITAIGTVAAGF
ncbi:hypothetical protein [Agromyces mariniharenae]|uniref:DUF2142 domain-containing protein n=1 Tax=Agromyces mariniharenae TaxID=2604423 RepID=A0A5S4VER3_9MICO|nr:hypothetical protein [Agromyces mariniharenae]TYL52525.1 hypothetical protein FYC51_01830 [Agromyces mariniharenae]